MEEQRIFYIDTPDNKQLAFYRALLESAKDEITRVTGVGYEYLIGAPDAGQLPPADKRAIFDESYMIDDEVIKLMDQMHEEPEEGMTARQHRRSLFKSIKKPKALKGHP